MRRTAAVLLLLAAACSGSGDDDEALDPFCTAYGELLTGPLADEATDASDPDVLEAAVASSDALLARLVEAAPAELGDAATALAADYEGTFAVLERYGYDLARVGAEATPEDQAVLDGFGSAEGGSFSVIQQWVAEHCAPDVTFPPDLLGSTTTTSP